MAQLAFTRNLQNLLPCPAGEFAGETVREVLEAAFGQRPEVRSYVLDDQGALRQHMQIFVDGAQIADRQRLSDPVSSGTQVYVMQALSGG